MFQKVSSTSIQSLKADFVLKNHDFISQLLKIDDFYELHLEISKKSLKIIY